MGFISFFAVAFPLAPIFSFFTNLLSLKLKLKLITKYGRRNQALGSNGIGNWIDMMRIISLIAVPINLFVLLYARNPGVKAVGALQDIDELEFEQQPEVTKFLLSENSDTWTRTNILTLFIIVEHALIAF